MSNNKIEVNIKDIPEFIEVLKQKENELEKYKNIVKRIENIINTNWFIGEYGMRKLRKLVIDIINDEMVG